uniref:Uncharacterized protein n=1 Tax=Romanomermis culicivorax TaxID=13658 RepID=A0A915HU31_ROMCU
MFPWSKPLIKLLAPFPNKFQAQHLRVQCKIQEQVQATNACFAALAEQMQQLISTTAAAAVACTNRPTSQPPPVTSRFDGDEPHDIYIPYQTLRETELALAYGRPLAYIKRKAPSLDTLYNNEFSCTNPGEDEISRAVPQ